MKIVTMKITALAIALVSILSLTVTGIITYANSGIIGATRSGDCEKLKKNLNENTGLNDIYNIVTDSLLYEKNDCLRVILEHLKSRNLTLDNHGLLLLNAIKTGNKGAIDLLIEYSNSTNLELQNNNKYNAVDAAIEYKNYALALSLIKRGFMPSRVAIIDFLPSGNPIIDSEKNDNEAKELLYELLKHKNQLPPSIPVEMFKNAVRFKDIELIDELINKFDNIILSSGIVPIIDRSKPKNIKLTYDMGIIKHLFDKGADPKSKEAQNALKLSVSNNDLEIVKFLLEKGTPATYDNSETGIMERTVDSNNVDMLKLLIDHGIDVNGSKLSGLNNPYTPLGRAINNLNPDFVSLLLKNGARKENVTVEGYDAFKLLDSTKKKILWYDFSHKKAADEIEALLKSPN